MSFIKNAVDTSLVGQTGTGAFAGSDSPALTTPSLGAATCDSLEVNGAYSLPRADGTAGQVITTTGMGVTSFQDIPSGTITGGSNLGGGTPTFAGVSGSNLTFNTLASGANITFSTVGNLTTISSTGSGTTFPYVQAYWVSQNNGSDADLGTSIETPFLTVQKAITSAGTTPTVIYVVDGFVNTETITTSGAGQVVYISALGTNFAGSFAIAATDSVIMECYISSALTCGGFLSLNATYQILNSTFLGSLCTAYITSQNINAMVLETDATVYTTCQTASGITNDTTATLNGTLGGTLPGLNGNNQISGRLTADSIAFTPTTHGIVGTTAADNAAAGYVGQYISSHVDSSPGVSIATATDINVTSISLTAGDWDVSGNVTIYNSATALYAAVGWASTTSATLVNASKYSGFTGNFSTNAFTIYAAAIPPLRVNVNTTTTVYLSARCNFTSGTSLASGTIQARRVR